MRKWHTLPRKHPETCYIIGVGEIHPPHQTNPLQPLLSINLKALALTSVLAVGGIFGSVAPASAGTCWFQNYSGSLSPTYCSTYVRINANGHRVVDVVDYEGTSFTLVFWNDSTVEILYTNGVYKGEKLMATWYNDKDGDRRIYVNDFEMSIRV